MANKHAANSMEECVPKRDQTSWKAIFADLKATLLQSNKPSDFFEDLRKTEQLDCYFLEVKKLIDLPQDPIRHPEGDVWNHTMLVLDAASEMRDRADYPLGFMMSALCHDFGKIVTTTQVDGEIHSYNHEVEGINIALEFLERLSDSVKLKEYVANMIKLHMTPRRMAKREASHKDMCTMFNEAISYNDLLLLAKADYCSRSSENDYSKTERFLNRHFDMYKKGGLCDDC